MDDTEILKMLDNPTEGDDFYQTMVKTLHLKYDKPRMLHEELCRTIADLRPIKATCKAMGSLATTLTHAVDGLSRLWQADFKYVATSLAVSALPHDIRSSWEDKSESSKQVPSAEDLVAFLRRKADNPMYKDSAVYSRPTEKKGVKQQPYRQKAVSTW